MTRFVRKQLKDALKTLVARLVVKAQLYEAAESNKRLEAGYTNSPVGSPSLSPPSTAGVDSRFPEWKHNRMSSQTAVSEMDGDQKSPVSNKAAYGRHPADSRSDNGGQQEQGPVELP